jgi:hypothetical protein
MNRAVFYEHYEHYFRYKICDIFPQFCVCSFYCHLSYRPTDVANSCDDHLIYKILKTLEHIAFLSYVTYGIIS